MLTKNNSTELKADLTGNLEREVVAFLNYRDGGDIYIGVRDDGAIVGVEDVDAMQLAIANRIRDNILPFTLGLFDIIREKAEGKEYIHIVVSSGPEKPYYLKKRRMSPKGCFLRVGSAAQPMDTRMINEIYARRVRNSLGRIISPRKNLSFEQLQIYYQSKGLTLNDKFAETLELLTKDEKYNYVAYLLADNNGTSIKVAKYAGADKIDLIENEEYGYCSLIKATKSVLDKLEIENKTFTKITSKERREKKLVDPIALREAVINAFVHNDYTSEVPPVFEIFSDRIQITSYGGLVGGLSEEEFFQCRSMSRNRELMRIFKDIGLVEQLGSGMGRILRAYDKSIFEITPNFLVVSLPFEHIDGSINGSIKSRPSPKDEIIIQTIRENDVYSKQQISETTGIPLSTVRNIMKQLIEKGAIERIGSNKIGRWIVK